MSRIFNIKIDDGLYNYFDVDDILKLSIPRVDFVTAINTAQCENLGDYLRKLLAGLYVQAAELEDIDYDSEVTTPIYLALAKGGYIELEYDEGGYITDFGETEQLLADKIIEKVIGELK